MVPKRKTRRRRITSLKELQRGMALCLENGEKLLEEAAVLIRHKKYARAFSLGVIAAEELGKLDVIFRYAQADMKSKEAWAKFKEEFCSHEFKQILSIVAYARARMLREGPAAVRKMFSARGGGRTLQQARELATYVDIKNRKFTSPSVQITPEQAKGIHETMKLSVEQAKEALSTLDLESVIPQIKVSPSVWENDPSLKELKQILQGVRRKGVKL